MKVVINRCFGGFSLSNKACSLLNCDKYDYDKHTLRTDDELIRVVELLGDEASGTNAELAVIEIPDDVEWEIENYDGRERVSEKHRVWV